MPCGLTAETVISLLENAEDYKAFELSVTADFDGRTAVERELVLRLAGLLWRLRRATAIETGLLQIHRGTVGAADPTAIHQCATGSVIAEPTSPSLDKDAEHKDAEPNLVEADLNVEIADWHFISVEQAAKAIR